MLCVGVVGVVEKGHTKSKVELLRREDQTSREKSMRF